MFKVTGQLHTGTSHIFHGNLDGFIVCGSMNHLKFEFFDDGCQRNTVSIDQIGHLFPDIEAIIPAAEMNINLFSKKLKKCKKSACFF